MTFAEQRANLKVVARLDALDARTMFLARLLVDRASKARVQADAQSLRQLPDQQRAYRGTCVRSPETI